MPAAAREEQSGRMRTGDRGIIRDAEYPGAARDEV